jgi:hypothetical protein
LLLAGDVMNPLRIAVALVSASLLVTAARARSQTAEEPKFQIELRTATEKGPKFTVTNRSDKAITACVFEISSSSETKQQTRVVWDAGIQSERPLERGASVTENLPRVVGGPLPDKVEVIAGIWADGQTFGQPDWVRVILQDRALRMSQYEQAISLLKQRLNEQWSRDQYLSALGSRQDSIAIYSIRSTLMANPQLGGRNLQQTIQRLLENITQRLEIVRQGNAP